MPLIMSPPLVHWKRDARNGHSPASWFYSRAVDAENHITAYRRREVFNRSWELGDTSYGYTGTTNLCRFRFRSGYGATILTFVVIMCPDQDGVGTDPRVEIDVTVSGGGTTTLTPFYYGTQATGLGDYPAIWHLAEASTTITEATVYEVLVKAIDYARVMSIMVYEQADLTVQESTNYYNSQSPTAGSNIFDSHQQRLLQGLSNMYRQNAGTLLHWGLVDGSARTRTSATLINLVDNTTTGTPTTATPGVYLTNTNRYSASRTSVPYEIGVYASIAAGSGTVRLTDTGGTDRITCTVNTTAQWFTATGSLPNTDAKYDLRFNGDGTNQISVYAVSLIEWE